MAGHGIGSSGKEGVDAFRSVVVGRALSLTQAPHGCSLAALRKISCLRREEQKPAGIMPFLGVG
jgi:hypothetical protein